MEEPNEVIFGEGVGPSLPGVGERERPAIPRPMVFVALAFIAGLVVGRHLLVPPLWPIVGAAAIAFGLAASLYRTRGRPAETPHSGLIILIAIALLGWSSSNHVVRVDRRAEAITERFENYALTRVEGRIAEPVVHRPNSVQVVLDDVSLASAPMGKGAVAFPLKVIAYLSGDWGEETNFDSVPLPRQGSRVVAWGRLSAPAGKTHPMDFDSVRYLAGRGVGATLRVREAGDIEAIEGAGGWRAAVFGSVAALRDKMRANLWRSLPEREAAIAGALLIGDRGSLDDATYTSFIRTGLAHILSVSGLHTGFILLMAIIAARLTGLGPRGCAWAGAAALLVYAALNGFRPPILRASIMGWFLLGAWTLGRTTSVLAAVATAAFFTLALDARNLLRIDWQLSYACVLSITLLAPAIYEMISGEEPDVQGLRAPRERKSWIKRILTKYIWLPLSVVLAIQMGLFPLHVGTFHQFSPYIFVANLLAVPLAFGVIAGAVVLSLLGWIGPLAIAAGFVLKIIIAIFSGIVTFFADLPWAAVEMRPLLPWAIAAYYGILLVGPHLRSGVGLLGRNTGVQKWHMALRVGLFFAVIVWLPFFARPIPGGLLELYVLDVGQGDSLVMRFPNGKVGVVDGGRPVSGRRRSSDVVSFLRWLGVERVDFVVATHADADHIGGLISVIKDFDVGLFIEGPDVADTGVFDELRAALSDRAVTVHRTRAGERLGGLGGVEIEFLNPWPGSDNNDASVVMLVDYDDVEVLLTGDIEKKAERTILGHGLAEDIDVLKVAHHGSKSSSSAAFLDAFAPEVALISAGRTNPYGHPAPEVLERLEERGINVVRTDQLGTIRLRTDGRRMSLDRFGD